jgi:nucleoside-diphosphate-sugar epimerase
MRILICGHRSFAASGLREVLEHAGHQVETFSRGESMRSGSDVSGDVFLIDENEHLAAGYDFVVNFILIKGDSVRENLAYANALLRFCNRIKPRALLQVSSISTYPRTLREVNEETPIASPGALHGPYAAVKTAFDSALQNSERAFHVSYLRPGFIVDRSNGSAPMAGIARRVLGPLHVILGDRGSPLPLIKRSQFHEAISRIIASEEVANCYLLFANDGGTKFSYARQHLRGPLCPLPKSATLLAAHAFQILGIFSARQLAQVEGLFCRTSFNSSETERVLGMKFR